MKTLTVTIPDDLYQIVQQQAAKQGATLPQQIVAWIQQFARSEQFTPSETPPESGGSNSAVERLLASLDRAKNTAPLGRLRREELYDRAIVH